MDEYEFVPPIFLDRSLYDKPPTFRSELKELIYIGALDYSMFILAVPVDILNILIFILRRIRTPLEEEIRRVDRERRRYERHDYG